MLNTLITSKTRIKLLLKFFLNASNTGYLKNLEAEFDDSSNGIRIELNKFEEAGLLCSENIRNKKVYRANVNHPLFNDIHSIVFKYAGLDHIINGIANRLGNINKIYIIGKLAKGLNSEKIELIIVGDVDLLYLNQLIEKITSLINKEITYKIYNEIYFNSNQAEILENEHLLIWSE